MTRKKGETITLLCAKCSWSSELAMSEATESQVVSCRHCQSPIYWHRCATCGLCYVGEQAPHCAVCDVEDTDDLTFG